MNTDTTLQISSPNSNVTEAIAKKVAVNLKGGEVIELSSDVGGGKTTFVKGLVAALGSKDHVSSPTFTVAKEYTTPNLRVCHFDFYRINEPGLVAHALREAMLDNNSVCCVEWSNVVDDVLPKERLVLQIQKDPHNENMRTLILTAPSELAYCLKGVSA